ncbi:hypothetical protein JD844_018643 [Phrynosoma platyrhinos]|uniref:Uncharacterized protein n=1 Tax=Phrynosoma platyrhinos TaxID=52577 RepID=A0ABQ7SNW3_PHRPL|nr:hypothetical protein JD844_018643 [Phrynosoma platyrhinos]
MSSKNSTASDTESECDFYSACWEENIVHTKKDSVDSDSESDLYLHPNSHHSLFEKRKGESILGKAVLILENSETNFTDCCRHCPLLQARKIDNTEEFQVDLFPESVLRVNFKDGYTSGHSSKPYSSKISQSKCDGCRDDVCLNCKIPHVFITENSVTGKIFHPVKEAGFDKLYQKQSSFDYSQSSKHNKSVQVSFPSRETESEEDFVSECFKQSSVHADINKTSANKPSIFHSAESQLADTHLGSCSNHSYKSEIPQTTEQIYFPTSSGELVISLTLEAAYLDPDASLADNIISSEVRVAKEDSERHDSAFKCKGSQQNQLVKKLCISIVPCPVQVDTGKQKHITPSTKQVGYSDILDAETTEFLAANVESSETSQSLAADTGSAESSCSDFHFNQRLSTLKHWAPCWFFPPIKHIHTHHSPHFCVGSLPVNKITSAYRTPEVEKEQPKPSRCVKSIVFTKNKAAQKDKQFRSRRHIPKFHCPKALSVEPINKNTQKAEISEVCYVPLTQATKCCCSPLLDLTVDLHSAGRDSERCLSIRRKPHKRTRGGKAIPRFSSHRLLDPISNLDRLQHICPVKRKNNLKMQNILNYWLGWSGQNTQKNSEGKICPTPNSPCLPADGKTSIDPLLSHLRNSSVPLSTATPLSNERRHSPPSLQTVRSPAALYLLPKDQRQPSATCIQTGRDTWSSETSYSHGRCEISHFPPENIVKVEQPQNERNMFTNTGVERLNCGAKYLACGGSATKKPPACPCGNMPQCGLFPNGEISELMKKKIKASPNIHRRANMHESDRMCSPIGSCNTEDACCGSCHHGFPPCCYNTGGQGPSRNQIIQVASFFENGFSPKNLKKDGIEKTTERKNVRFHAGPDALQMYPSGTQPASPLNDGSEIPKHYHHECSCCRPGTKEHLAISGEKHCFGVEHKRLNGCINRESIFLVDCGQETRSQCTCSQEIPLFRTDHTDMCNEKRSAISTQKESDFQDSSQIADGWKRLHEKHKCCHNNIWYNHLQ